MLAHLFTHWNIRFRAFASTCNVCDMDDAEVVLVMPVRFNGSTELVPLDRRYVVCISLVWEQGFRRGIFSETLGDGARWPPMEMEGLRQVLGRWEGVTQFKMECSFILSKAFPLSVVSTSWSPSYCATRRPCRMPRLCCRSRHHNHT